MSQSPELKSNFRLGFLFLPREKREALSAVYAFCRHVDDAVDVPGTPPPIATEAPAYLSFWKEEILRLYKGFPTHPISQRLLPCIRSFPLPSEAFLDILEGVEMDLRISRYETFEALETYLFRVASSVGLLAIEIFGYAPSSHAALRDYARFLGYAFQMTNILRDVGSDLRRNRLYLPLEDLKRFNVSLESLQTRSSPQTFLSLMEFECERAKSFYRRARQALPPQDRKNMLPAEVMASIYETLLEKLRANRFDVLDRHVRLGVWEKLRAVLSAWRNPGPRTPHPEP